MILVSFAFYEIELNLYNPGTFRELIYTRGIFFFRHRTREFPAQSPKRTAPIFQNHSKPLRARAAPGIVGRET